MNEKSVYLFLFLATGMLACTKETSSPTEAIRISNDASQASTAKKSFINSRVFLQAMNELGQCDSISYFLLRHENITEFRIELLNLYTKQNLEDSIGIVEATWSKSLFKNITIWYEQDSIQWKEVHQATWAKGAEF